MEKNSHTLEGILCFHAEAAAKGGQWVFQDKRYISSEGLFDYRGMHVLKGGDHLQIADPETMEVVYEGVVEFESYPPFTKSVQQQIQVNKLDIPALESDFEEYFGQREVNYEVDGEIVRVTSDRHHVWITDEPKGIEVEVWASYFFRGYQATLTPAEYMAVSETILELDDDS